MPNQNPIHEEVKLQALNARKARLDAEVNASQKALANMKIQAQANAQRTLPESTKPAHAPLLKAILAIPETQEMNRLEDTAIAQKASRGRINAYVDHWYPILKVKLDEELRLRRIKKDWVRRKEWESWDRTLAARAKKSLKAQGKVELQGLLQFRAVLKREYMEKGEFDVVGREDESFEDWWERVENLNGDIWHDWQICEAQILAEAPRYLEGFPVRDRIDMPRVWTGYSLPSGRPPCWQCHIKRMVCSLQITRYDNFGHVVREGKGCTRCSRAGDTCYCKSNRLEVGWRKAALTDDQKRRLAEDPDLRNRVSRSTQEQLIVWAEKNCAGVGVDFFNTHLQRFSFSRKKVERKMSIGFNTHWWERKKREEMSRNYWKNRKERERVGPEERERMNKEAEERRERIKKKLEEARKWHREEKERMIQKALAVQRAYEEMDDEEMDEEEEYEEDMYEEQVYEKEEDEVYEGRGG